MMYLLSRVVTNMDFHAPWVVVVVGRAPSCAFWTVQYITRLLVKLTPKGILFFLVFSCSVDALWCCAA